MGIHLESRLEDGRIILKLMLAMEAIALTNLLILLPEIKIVIYTTYSELSILLDLE
jgi:hypothetical protein